MNNITPGTLCLVIRGRNAGKTCVVKSGPVSVLQVQDELANSTRKAVFIREYPEDPILEVDPPMVWSCKKTGEHCGEHPYMRQRSLLPIPPLADPITTKQEEEKPCTV